MPPTFVATAAVCLMVLGAWLWDRGGQTGAQHVGSKHIEFEFGRALCIVGISFIILDQFVRAGYRRRYAEFVGLVVFWFGGLLVLISHPRYVSSSNSLEPIHNFHELLGVAFIAVGGVLVCVAKLYYRMKRKTGSR